MTYKAILSQSEENNPIVKKLSSGILDYTFERTSTGSYVAIPNIQVGVGVVIKTELQAGENPNMVKVGVNVVDSPLSPIVFTFYNGTQSDGVLNNTYIEITPINVGFIEL